LGTRPYGKNVWADKPGFITGTDQGAIATALVHQHLRSVMAALGMILMGGEAYVTFRPNLIDHHGDIADEGTRKFLQDFIDRFAVLVRRHSPAAKRAAA
jgi:chromate reductase